MSDQDEFGAFLLGFIVGGLTGAVASLLMAPQSGESTRSLLKDKAIQLGDQVSVSVEDARARSETILADARTRSDSILADAKVKADEIMKQARVNVEDLQKRGQVVLEEQRQKVTEVIKKQANGAEGEEVKADN